MSNMQTNQTPEALAEECQRLANQLGATSLDRSTEAELVAAINRLRDMAASGAKDAERLDALREHSWDVRSFDMPTGAGDADIGWKVVEHHEGKPHEREVGCAYRDDPREAIDAAIAAKNRGVA